LPSDLVQRDLRHLWHPCAQMRDYEAFPPLEVVSAQGSRLHLKEGRSLIDAISSWWCKSLGHGHPRLKAALARQMDRFEHVILANTTHEIIVRLSERLADLSPGLSRVFYAGDGSTAVEIACKMALQASRLAGRRDAARGGIPRARFLALENGYHGETALTLALGDLGIYKEAYREILPPVSFLRGLPYLENRADPTGKAGAGAGRAPEDLAGNPLWSDCAAAWPALERQLEAVPGLCAVVLEPVLQGAGGMRLYSPDLLRRLRAWTSAHGVWLIADEILTGFHRTGPALACSHAGIRPDFLCLSKGLTAGWLPMSALLTTEEVYGLFYGEYGSGRDFLHSNTYAGNALAAAVALEALDVYRDEGIEGRVLDLGAALRRGLSRVAGRTGRLTALRGLGGMAAADLTGPGVEPGARAGYRVYREAVARGALLRTLGDTVYWLPPLNTSLETVEELEEITAQAIEAALG
jgi:adenosylmethionine---8-amino-7-oxononanoate aminotransferase